MVAAARRVNAWGAFQRTGRGAQAEANAHRPAGDHQRRDHSEADGEPGPDADPLPAAAKGEPDANAQPRHPITEQCEQHRHPGVVEPAEHARPDHLGAVDDLERGRDGEEGHPQLDHPGIARHIVEEQSDELARDDQHDDRHRRHEPDSEAPGGPPGARDSGGIIAAERPADPHRCRLSETQRDHEAQRRDLQSDRMAAIDSESISPIR